MAGFETKCAHCGPVAVGPVVSDSTWILLAAVRLRQLGVNGTALSYRRSCRPVCMSGVAVCSPRSARAARQNNAHVIFFLVGVVSSWSPTASTAPAVVWHGMPFYAVHLCVRVSSLRLYLALCDRLVVVVKGASPSGCVVLVLRWCSPPFPARRPSARSATSLDTEVMYQVRLWV